VELDIVANLEGVCPELQVVVGQRAVLVAGEDRTRVVQREGDERIGVLGQRAQGSRRVTEPWLGPHDGHQERAPVWVRVAAQDGWVNADA
jgi:hypothetical protein